MAVTGAGYMAATPSAYQAHALHAAERTWSETNCYVDLWIEVLHDLGLDPLAAAGFTLSSDFEGAQWTFIKPPPEDLRLLFGIDVAELNIWQPIRRHVVEQLDVGSLVTLEVDAFYLPDTVGVSYRHAHSKTTIVPRSIDVEERRLSYFHNAGCFMLDGDDFEGVLPDVGPGDGDYLAPYVERILLSRVHADAGLPDRARAVAADHLARRPVDNPIRRMGERMLADVPGLAAAHDMEVFHRYAFGTCRQCGASAEIAADHVQWLSAHAGVESGNAAELLREVAVGAKTMQFLLARAVNGRAVDLLATVETMATAYDEAMRQLDAGIAG